MNWLHRLAFLTTTWAIMTRFWNDQLPHNLEFILLLECHSFGPLRTHRNDQNRTRNQLGRKLRQKAALFHNFSPLKIARGVTKPPLRLVLDILSWHAKFQGIPVVWKARRAVSMIFSHLGAEIELRFIDSLTRDFILWQLETLDFGSKSLWWELTSQSNFWDQG